MKKPEHYLPFIANLDLSSDFMSPKSSQKQSFDSPENSKIENEENLPSPKNLIKLPQKSIETLRSRYIEVLKKSYLRMYKAKYLKFPKNIFHQTQTAKTLAYKDLRSLSTVVQGIALKYSKSGIFDYLINEPKSIIGGNVFLSKGDLQEISKSYISIINKYCSQRMDQTTLFFALKPGDSVNKIKKIDEIKIFTYAYERDRGCFPDPKKHLIWVPISLCYNQKEFMVHREKQRIISSSSSVIEKESYPNKKIKSPKVATISRFSMSPKRVMNKRPRLSSFGQQDTLTRSRLGSQQQKKNQNQKKESFIKGFFLKKLNQKNEYQRSQTNKEAAINNQRELQSRKQSNESPPVANANTNKKYSTMFIKEKKDWCEMVRVTKNGRKIYSINTTLQFIDEKGQMSPKFENKAGKRKNLSSIQLRKKFERDASIDTLMNNF